MGINIAKLLCCNSLIIFTLFMILLVLSPVIINNSLPKKPGPDNPITQTEYEEKSQTVGIAVSIAALTWFILLVVYSWKCDSYVHDKSESK